MQDPYNQFGYVPVGPGKPSLFMSPDRVSRGVRGVCYTFARSVSRAYQANH